MSDIDLISSLLRPPLTSGISSCHVWPPGKAPTAETIPTEEANETNSAPVGDWTTLTQNPITIPITSHYELLFATNPFTSKNKHLR